MTFLPDHVHVSEREAAHIWPDGQHDDSAWEDCTFMSGVELVRLCHDAGVPATHAEGEHLRDDAGKPPLGGSNIGDLINGLKRRYGWLVGWVKAVGFTAVWSALTPGKAAAVQGSMGAFAAGHRLRRFDPPFHGGHCVFVVRADSSDRVWWCDPLAPVGTYRGEWVSKSELKAFVSAFDGASLVASYVKEAALMAQAPVTSEVPVLIDVLPGSVLVELDGATVIKTLTGTYRSQVSPYAVGALRAWYATINDKLRVVLVKSSTLNARPYGITPAALAAAQTTSFANGRMEGVSVGQLSERDRIKKVVVDFVVKTLGL